MSGLIPAISLHQPYASLVALGLKTLETRKTRTHHRGELLICSTLTFDEEAWCRIRGGEGIGALGELLKAHQAVAGDRLPRGVALAIVDVVGCRQLLPADEPRAFFFAPGRWAWELQNARRVQPVPVRGQQGRFSVERRWIEPLAGGVS